MKYWYKKIQLCPYWPYETLYVYLSIETHEKTHHNLYFKTGSRITASMTISILQESVLPTSGWKMPPNSTWCTPIFFCLYSGVFWVSGNFLQKFVFLIHKKYCGNKGRVLNNTLVPRIARSRDFISLVIIGIIITWVPKEFTGKNSPLDSKVVRRLKPCVFVDIFPSVYSFYSYPCFSIFVSIDHPLPSVDWIPNEVFPLEKKMIYVF